MEFKRHSHMPDNNVQKQLPEMAEEPRLAGQDSERHASTASVLRTVQARLVEPQAKTDKHSPRSPDCNLLRSFISRGQATQKLLRV